MLSAAFFGLIYITILARLVALVQAVRTRLIQKYPFFCLLTIVSLSRGVVSVTAGGKYYSYFHATQWPVAVLEAAALIEAFWRVAANFRRIRGFAWALMAGLAGVSVLVAAGVGLIRANWNEPVRGAILFSMYTNVAMLITALLSIAFFRQFRRVPIPPNAIRHLAILSLLFASFFGPALLINITRGQYRYLPSFLTNGGITIACFWWVYAITREGENPPFEAQREMTSDEFDAAEARHRREASELKQASDTAVRKLRY